MAWDDGLTKGVRRARLKAATDRARRVLRMGDRIVVTRCPGTKRTVTFEHWDGDWIVSRSGIDDISASNISKVNGEPVNFLEPK